MTAEKRGMLTQRQETVLAIVTRDYVATGVPLGSNQLLKRHNLGVSAATIRSEMATLEAMGYLCHPHTSAGRIPTEQGYRYFVEHLVKELGLPLAEKRLIRHQFHQAQMDVNQWMKLSAAVLAHVSQMASLVTVPKAHYCRFKHLEMVPIRESVVLLIVVLSESLVKQRFITVPDSFWSREELQRIANYWSDRWVNWRGDEIQAMATPADMSSLEKEVQSVVCEIMQRVDQRSISEIYRDGLLQVLRNPDFFSSESLQQVVLFIEERQILESVLAEIGTSDSVQVIIGGEGRWPELSDLSIVVAPYGYKTDRVKSGFLGIVGPMRMPYQRNISAVRYVARLMTTLLGELYGQR